VAAFVNLFQYSLGAWFKIALVALAQRNRIEEVWDPTAAVGVGWV